MLTPYDVVGWLPSQEDQVLSETAITAYIVSGLQQGFLAFGRTNRETKLA